MTEKQKFTKALREQIWRYRDEGKTALQISELVNISVERVRYYFRKRHGNFDKLHGPFIERIRSGFPPKAAAADVGIAIPTGWKWASAAGFRKQWITDAEFSEILAKRKAAA